MGETDGNLTVTFSGIVMSFGVTGVLDALGEGDGSTVEAEPSSAEDEPSPNNPLSFPEHTVNKPLVNLSRDWRWTNPRENHL
jgi:hypothetical protein